MSETDYERISTDYLEELLDKAKHFDAIVAEHAALKERWVDTCILLEAAEARHERVAAEHAALKQHIAELVAELEGVAYRLVCPVGLGYDGNPGRDVLDAIESFKRRALIGA